jgi:hypothetical protein
LSLVAGLRRADEALEAALAPLEEAIELPKALAGREAGEA